ncbi:MAG: S-layer homology domain-containing protein [Bifidobacteriaceae bacterium]|jgi:hypothetical protein|nr:S-layer homology domain-containing protein [Bifidobacteriaceae bacterium]
MKENNLFNFLSSQHFISRGFITLIVIALGLTILLVDNLPQAYAIQTQTNIILNNSNQKSNNQTADKITLTGLADPPPAPRNVATTQSDLKTLKVSWQAPATPPTNYTYTIELYNNVNAVAVTKTGIPQTDSQYLFSNLPANNYIATKVYTVTADGVSSPATSNTIIHNSLEAKGQIVNFKDTSSLPQLVQDDIVWAQSYNILHGYPNFTFQPNKATTRAQMATFMRKLAGNPVITKPILNFTDISKNKHKDDIAWASSENITIGYDCIAKGVPVKTCQAAGDKVFRPDGSITREQMAIFMYQFAKAPIITAGDKLQLNRFKDSNNLSDSMAKTAVSWLIKTKLTAGYPDDEFKADKLVTRQQMVIFLQSLAAELELMPYLELESNNPTNFLNTGLVRTTITKVDFIKSFPQCDAPIDISYNNFNGVKACVDGTELTIGEPGGVFSNPVNSNWLLGKLNNSAGVKVNIDNLHANHTRSMANMFNNSLISNNLNLSKGFGSMATDMRYMWAYASLLNGLSLPAGFGSVATFMNNSFQETVLPANFSLPVGFGSAATSMNYMFARVTLPANFSLLDGFGSAATDMTDMFYSATFNGDITLPFTFGQNMIQAYSFMHSTSIKGNLTIKATFPKATGVQYFLQINKISGDVIIPDNFMPVSYDYTIFSYAKIDGKLIIGDNFLTKTVSASSGLMQNAEIKGGLYIGNNFLPSVTSSSSLFDFTKINGIHIGNNFMVNTTTCEYMFQRATISGNLTIGTNFVPKCFNINNLFSETTISNDLVLPNGFGSAATNMSNMFRDAKLNGDIDWSGTNLSVSTATKTNMFTGTVWNGHFILAQNQASVNWLIDNTGAAATNVKVKGK